MNTRQKTVLASVVKLYTETATPVGSESLLDHFHFDVSAATLRNDMLALEDEGYLYQPHTSAGRIPTDKGYRYFVTELMHDRPLTRREQENLEHEFLTLKAKHQRLARTTARLLSSLSGNLAVSAVLDKDDYSDFGMKELMEEPEFQGVDELTNLVEMLDTLDEKIEFLVHKVGKDKTQIFIGEENPITEIQNCAMIVSPYRTSEGQMGILAIIGPKRMEYAKNKSLLEHMKKLLSSSAALILIVQATHYI